MGFDRYRNSYDLNATVFVADIWPVAQPGPGLNVAFNTRTEGSIRARGVATGIRVRISDYVCFRISTYQHINGSINETVESPTMLHHSVTTFALLCDHAG